MAYETFTYCDNTSMSRTEFKHIEHEHNWGWGANILTTEDLLAVGIVFPETAPDSDMEILTTDGDCRSYRVVRNDDGDIIDLVQLRDQVCVSEMGTGVTLYTADKETGTPIEEVISFDQGLHLIERYVDEDRKNGEDSEGFYCIVTANHREVEREDWLGLDILRYTDGRIVDVVRR